MRRLCSFWAPRSVVEVLATFVESEKGPGKVCGLCLCVVGCRRLLATGGLALWMEMCMYVWGIFRHIRCLLNTF